MEAQIGRLTATIHGLDADVVALMEVENHGYGPNSAIAQLVAALNRAFPFKKITHITVLIP